MSRVLPILFNTEMVQAILDGRKTVTRRVINPKYRDDEGGFRVCTNKATGGRWVEKYDLEGRSFDGSRYVKPPYQPGDILYVRETVWQQYGKTLDMMTGDTEFFDINIFRYCAADTEPIADEYHHWRKRPSIHMPKEAARIWLKVTDVRVERLQDITFEDCLNEGAFVYLAADGLFDRTVVEPEAKKKFSGIWNYTIKKSDFNRYGWDANPWVWVIKFERCEKPCG